MILITGKWDELVTCSIVAAAVVPQEGGTRVPESDWTERVGTETVATTNDGSMKKARESRIKIAEGRWL